MSLLRERFSALRAEQRCGFIPFIVAGDPDLQTTGELLLALSRLDPVAIEVGVPFSDPTADGPVIQRAAERSLRNGTSLGKIFQMLEQSRPNELAPIVLFSYYNPILQFGIERFTRAAEKCSVAGVLVVDLPAEAAAPLHEQLRRRNIDFIFLVTPTTIDRRLKQIARLASGFIYAVSRTGITGVREKIDQSAKMLVRRIRTVTKLPVAVGFGISSAAQVRDVWRYADAAVVGSAIVSEIERLTGDRDLVRGVGQFARTLIE